MLAQRLHMVVLSVLALYNWQQLTATLLLLCASEHVRDGNVWLCAMPLCMCAQSLDADGAEWLLHALWVSPCLQVIQALMEIGTLCAWTCHF